MDDDLSEEMKMILELTDKLNLQIRATGGPHVNAPIDSSLFGRVPVQYIYIVTPKPPGPPG